MKILTTTYGLLQTLLQYAAPRGKSRPYVSLHTDEEGKVSTQFPFQQSTAYEAECQGRHGKEGRYALRGKEAELGIAGRSGIPAARNATGNICEIPSR